MLRTNQLVISFVSVFLLLNTNLYAQVVTDGTLESKLGKTNLPGPDFRIVPELGEQHDGNLFHSFEVFDLHANESATFSGPTNVENILARVTGGQPSLIDGTLRSEIPNANLYLLNPNSILFGRNASLDISGSFHASTADYIRLEDGKSFYARPDLNAKPLLTSAKPEAFGFLSQPAPIIIHDSLLAVIPRDDKGRTLSIIGGDLTIDDATLNAPAGRVNLISVASKGEVMVSDQNQGIDSFEKLGTITLLSSPFAPERQLANVDVSGENGGGQIFIRAGQFFANHASLFADNYGGNQNGSIDISVRGEMRLSNTTKITAGNFGPNQQSGSIKINAMGPLFVGLTKEELKAINPTTEELELISATPERSEEIFEQLYRQGSQPPRNLKKDIFSNIGTGNFCCGIGADISITTPALEVSYGLIEAFTVSDGNAGNVQVNASQVNLHDYGLINAAVGVDPKYTAPNSSGHAGNIQLRDIDGISPVRQISLSNNSTISVSTDPETHGDAGNIDLKTQDLVLTDESQINSFSYGYGEGGLINIEANKTLLTNKSGIWTEADNAGGGDITLHVRDWLVLFNSKITAKAWGKEGKGGNLTINKSDKKSNNKFKILALSKSQLLASANQDYGGDINIQVKNRLGSRFEINQGQDFEQRDLEERDYNVIDASSKKGEVYYGKIDFNAQSWEFPGSLPFLGLTHLPSLNSSRCSFSKDSRFIITSRDVLPRCPEDLRTHTIRLGNYY